MHDYHIGIGYDLKRLQAQVRLVSSVLDHLHQPLRVGHAVDASGTVGALNSKVAALKSRPYCSLVNTEHTVHLPVDQPLTICT
jgi:hypothetical protein